ncbi:MAG: hypothetical protein AAFQ87_02690 [Bacteroidota bacterium]
MNQPLCHPDQGGGIFGEKTVPRSGKQKDLKRETAHSALNSLP